MRLGFNPSIVTLTMNPASMRARASGTSLPTASCVAACLPGSPEAAASTSRGRSTGWGRARWRFTRPGALRATCSRTRENVNVLEEETGRQFRFVFPGPRLATPDWEACLGALDSLEPGPAWIVASGSLPPGVPVDFYAGVARSARRVSARFALDASGEALSRALDEGVSLVKPSLREFQQLTGLTDAEESHLAREAAKLIAAGRCETIVLSLGAAGALAVRAEGAERIVSPTVPVRSTVGAGDTLLAGIVLRLQQGRTVSEAVRFGVAAAASTAMRPGTELCRREDAERLYEQIPGVGERLAKACD
jgi:6-phosphofructokinase 2